MDQDPATPAPTRRPGELSFAARRRLFLIGAAGLGALMLWGLGGLPDYRDFTPLYGQVMNEVAVEERSTTAVVTAVNFDYRGFDTLGEEFILFAAVLVLALLLRRLREERQGQLAGDPRHRHTTSAAVRLTCVALVGPTVLLSIYITMHGHLTPGGGFQGGVIAATALLLVYLGSDYTTMRATAPDGAGGDREGGGRRRLRADRPRRADRGGGVPGELPAARRAGRAVLGRNDPAAQHRRRRRGGRRLRAPALGVPGPDCWCIRRKRGAPAVELPAVRRGRLDLPRRPVRDRHQPQPDPPVVCLSVVQSSTYVLLLAVGYRNGCAAPVFIDIPRDTPAVDPVVQALTLTDVVVGGAVTALLLALAVQIAQAPRHARPRRARSAARLMPADLAPLAVAGAVLARLPCSRPALPAAVPAQRTRSSSRPRARCRGRACVLLLRDALDSDGPGRVAVRRLGAAAGRRGGRHQLRRRRARRRRWPCSPPCWWARRWSSRGASSTPSGRSFHAIDARLPRRDDRVRADRRPVQHVRLLRADERVGVRAHGYRIERAASLQGALTFAVTNSVGAVMILFGIALLYGRTGALNLAQVGEALAQEPSRRARRGRVRADHGRVPRQGRDRAVPLLARRRLRGRTHPGVRSCSPA